MATIDYPKVIQSLELSYALLPKRPDTLSKSDLKTLGEACTLYLKYYESFVGTSIDPRIDDVYSFHKYVINSEIERLVNKFKEAEEAEKEAKREKPKEQVSSIPPELEALVAEYRQNQALLESEEIKGNSQKSVAVQVKMALAHSKIRALALANRQHRLAKGENIQAYDDVLVSLGSPKSESKTAALAASYKAVQEVASTHDNFKELPEEIQEKIVAEAVELNLACVTNIDVAVQSAALLIDTKSLSPEIKKQVSSISSNFVHSVYDVSNAQTQQAVEYQTQIAKNEVVIQQLAEEAKSLISEELEIKLLKIKSLSSLNQQLTKKIDNQSLQYELFLNNNTPEFDKFSDDSKKRLSQDPDLIDKIEQANKDISDIHAALEKKGIVPHIYTPMDDVKLLEDAIRHDMPGKLRQFSGYEASYAAALISDPKTQSTELSPQAILLYSQDLTPELFAKIRHFSETNKEDPNSELGKLLKTRPEIFDSAESQIKKIANSPLAQEISQKITAGKKVSASISNYFQKLSEKPTGVGKATKSILSSLEKIVQSPLGKRVSKIVTGINESFKSISGFVNKISDKINSFSKVFGKVYSVVQNPLGALKSWAGRKAGKKFIQIIKNKLPQKILSKIPSVLLKGGIAGAKTFVKDAVVRLAIKGITWVAAKVGISIAAESLNAIAPGLGVLVDIAIQVIIVVAEKTIGAAKKAFDEISTSIYGEKIKARDVIAVPIAGIATATAAVVGGVIAFFGALGTATAAAASSAVAIAVTGVLVGGFFYITSIVMAPLISTLVQLESTTKLPEQNCGNTPLLNDKKLCKTFNGKDYCFPVNDLSTINYATAHHDYYAVDIFRNGDIVVPADDIPLPILAYTGGTVTWISETDGLGGYSFIISGTDGLFYYYAHNMCNLVSLGQPVSAGDVIAGMDSSGGAITTIEHVHFQISDQSDMRTIPENYPHFFPPWDDFCKKLNLCGSH